MAGIADLTAALASADRNRVTRVEAMRRSPTTISLSTLGALSALWGILYFMTCSGRNSRGVLADASSGMLQTRQSDSESLNSTGLAQAAINGLNARFYESSNARWSSDEPWWISGVALTMVIEYMRRSGSKEYLDQVEDVIEVQRQPLSWWPSGEGEFRADATNDTGWWALAMVRMYDLTGNEDYLNISIKDEAYMRQWWTDTECGGGLYVDIQDLTYKNAIANELYLKLVASLANRAPNATIYLDRAQQAWTWFLGSGMINGVNLINDGLARDSNTGSCYNNRLPVWTYNQGVILGALVELYHATKDESYLLSAQAIADAVLSPSNGLTSSSGVLTETCEGSDSCNQDQQVFKGVFALNLAELGDAVAGASSDPDAGQDYREYLDTNMQSMYANDRSEIVPTLFDSSTGDLYDVSWSGPFRNATMPKQASAIGLYVANI
uniref:Uncharacterized protein n=1 Tax=Chaetomium thermophilum (strain DSM 1495 / CBS 144.50 / IMI 039719) TaxID=759272 RepID=UPI003F77845F